MAGDVLTKTQMINFCMLNPMQAGRVFPQNHQNLTYIEAYIKAHEGGNPCGMNPCGANPCGANPCGANPCGANPCGK